MVQVKPEKTCGRCKYAYMQDHGYSNWTVEGTTFTCLAKKHPADDFDRFYGHDERLLYAFQCDTFQDGGPGLELCVEDNLDDIEEYTDDEELITLYNAL